MTAYLNNAATSFPKPPVVLAAFERALRELPIEAGRSAAAEDPTADCREQLARLWDVPDVRQVILTPSATYALNLVIQGLLRPREVPEYSDSPRSEDARRPQVGSPGSNAHNRCVPAHVVTTTLEHNSVLRPLEHLQDEGWVKVSYLTPTFDGRIRAEDLPAHLRPKTALLVVTHVSNVTGAIQPIEELADLAAHQGIPLLIDASQSAGAVPLSWRALPGRVFVAFAGHKGLFGPTGTGGLIVPDAQLPPLLVGGTGILSESRLQPERLPLRYEAGTPNLAGLAGLAAGVRFVRERGIHRLGQHRNTLVQQLREGLAHIPGIRMTPLPDNDGRGGIVSFAAEGWTAQDLSYALLESFAIHTRAGLHCAPRAHQELGLPSEGTVRLSVAEFNTEAEVEELLEAMQSLVGAACAV